MLFYEWEMNYGLVPRSSDYGGKVLENGMPSSFRRFTEAGIEDIKSRTEELAQFIDAASKRYDFSRRRLIVVSYANGANLAASFCFTPITSQVQFFSERWCPWYPI